MGDKIGKAVAAGMGKAVAPGILAGISKAPTVHPFKGPTIDALVARKTEEMRREIDRLAAAMQLVQHRQRRVPATAGDLFALIQAWDQVRGWILSLVESQAYIDSVGDPNDQFEMNVRRVAAAGKNRAQAERLIASPS